MSETDIASALSTPIADLVLGPAVVVEPKATLHAVANVLGDLGIGMVVVYDSEVRGVVSERDLVWAIARDADLDEIWAADIMTQDVMAVPPATTVDEAAATMVARNARHILVDYPDRPAVVSLRDIVAHIVG